jgi:hypothetical protein
MDLFKDMRSHYISRIQESGSHQDKEQLGAWLEKETECGESTPVILLMRLSNQWVREHTKAYQTPTILKKWKDNMPAPVAAWFFHECDIIAIEDAYFFDFSKEPGERISKLLVATCYAYLDLTGESSRHGVWHQGQRIFNESSRLKSLHAARVLRELSSSGVVHDKEDDYVTKYCQEIANKGTSTCDLNPYSFSGVGRNKLLGLK